MRLVVYQCTSHANIVLELGMEKKIVCFSECFVPWHPAWKLLKEFIDFHGMLTGVRVLHADIIRISKTGVSKRISCWLSLLFGNLLVVGRCKMEKSCNGRLLVSLNSYRLVELVSVFFNTSQDVCCAKMYLVLSVKFQ